VHSFITLDDCIYQTYCTHLAHYESRFRCFDLDNAQPWTGKSLDIQVDIWEISDKRDDGRMNSEGL